MGSIDNNKLISISGGLVLGLGVLLSLVLGSKSNDFSNSEARERLQIKTDVAGHAYVSGAAPKARWRAFSQMQARSGQASSQPFDSGYKPGASYANNYIPAEEIRHPLIASAKFIKKRDKLKAKKTKEKLAKKSSRYDENGRLKPLSESPDSASSITSTSVATAAVKAKKKATADEEKENLNSVEFWEEPIFVQEDATAVDKLVDSYRGRKVSSGVFYSVVNQMTVDDRTNIRELGVSALGTNPSSQSFSQLTWVKHNDADAELRTTAGRYIASYTDISKLNYVVSTLNSSNTSQLIAVEALRTLTASTQKYSNGGLTGSGGEQPTYDASQISALETRYSRALELIEENNLANSSNVKVKTEATKTVASINKFMTI